MTMSIKMFGAVVVKFTFICFISLLIGSCWHKPILTGDNPKYQIDGSINDSDASTLRAGMYSSQQQTDSHVDGLSIVISEILSFKELQGKVDIELDPTSIGPFSGLPRGASSQKVGSEFTLAESKNLMFDLVSTIEVLINGSGVGEVEILMSVSRNTGSTLDMVMDSISTSRYRFTEDPNDEDIILYTVNQSTGASSNGSINEGDVLIDPSLLFDDFRLQAGSYTVLFELNVRAGGDTDMILVDANSEISLEEIP